MLETWDKTLNVKVDVYKHDLSNLTTASSWFLEDEDGNSHFKYSIKPTAGDIGNMRGIKYAGSFEGTYNLVEVTPYATTGEMGEKIDASFLADGAVVNGDKITIGNIQETCMLLHEKLPLDKPTLLDVNAERLYHIQIPYMQGDYASIYICVGFTSKYGSSSSSSGKAESMTFINENTVKLNIYDSSDFKSTEIDPPGLLPKIWDITLILTHSSGNSGIQNDIGSFLMIRYNGTDDKDRYVNIGGIINTNLAKLLSTVTPDVTP